MTMIENGTLGRCSALGLATQGTAQTVQQDGEVNVCFQSACLSWESYLDNIKTERDAVGNSMETGFGD